MKQLYINGELVDLEQSEPIAITKQVNNIAELKSRQADYSNQFKVPYSKNNDRIFGFTSYVNSQSNKPYRKMPCKLVQNGQEIIPNGVAIIEEAMDSVGYDITVYSGVIDFFEAIDKELSELDLSAFNHAYHVNTIVSSFGNEAGYIYPLIQYGGFAENSNYVDIKYLIPGMYLHTIIHEIITQAGYTYEGDIFNDNFYRSLIVPGVKFEHENFAESRSCVVGITPTFSGQFVGFFSFNQEFNPVVQFGHETNQIKRQATVTAGSKVLTALAHTYDLSTNTIVSGPGIIEGTSIESIDSNSQVTLSVNASGSFTDTLTFTDGDFRDGDSDCFNGSIYTYTANDYYAVDIKAKIYFYAESGSVNTVVQLLKNGSVFQEYADKDHNQGDGHVYGFHDAEFTNIVLQPGDKLKIVFKVRNRDTGSTNAGFWILAKDRDLGSISVTDNHQETNQHTRLEILVKNTIIDGFIVSPSIYLPDLNQKDILKDFMQRFCLIVDVDSITNKLRFISFKAIADRRNAAQDWSRKLKFRLREKPSISFRFPEYAQKNWFRYLKEDDKGKSTIGDYYFNINDETLKKELDAVESIYAPSDASLILSTGESTAKIPVFVDGERQEVKPRILALKYVGGKIGLIDSYNVTTTDYTGLLPLTFFEDRDRPKDLTFKSHIENNYTELIDALKKCKIVSAYFDLTDVDVANVDFFTPIWVSYFNEFFYLNKIEEYRTGTLTKCQLVRL